MKQTVLAVLCLILTVGEGHAQRYSVSLTRKDKNLYKITGEPLWVRTKYCYEYAYGEQATLTSYEVSFDNGSKCDVREVLKEFLPDSGTFKVTVSNEDGGLYSTPTGIYVLTSLCLELALGEEAILKVQPYGSSLVFIGSRTECQVERFIRKVRL